MKLIDTHCSFGYWPTQQFRHTKLHHLDESMAANQINEVWLTATESILFDDPDVYDFALFRKIREFPRFRPVKIVNPTLPRWRESCQKAINEFGVVALKIYPNYHNYPANHAELCHLADFAGKNQLPLITSIRVHDERNQTFPLQVPSVNTAALHAHILTKFPKTTFILHGLTMGELPILKTTPNVYADISFLDQADPLFYATTELGVPSKQLVFGTHATFFYPESSTNKLRWTRCSREQITEIAGNNILSIHPDHLQPV